MQNISRVASELKEKGYALVRGVIPPEDIAAAKQRLRYLAEHAEFYSRHGIIFNADPGAAGAPHNGDPLARYAQIRFVTYRDRVCWDKLAAHPNMVRLVASVLGPDFYLNSTAVFCKPAKHGSIVPWHQDSALWGLKPDAWTAETAPVLFDWWMALDHATRENGCLQLLPGSHKKGIVPHGVKGGLMKEADPTEFGFDPGAAVHVEAAPGDVAVWHQDMFHYSGPNRSDRPRLAAVGTYVAARDLPLMRRLRPEAKLLDKVPVALRGSAVELPEYVPASAS